MEDPIKTDRIETIPVVAQMCQQENVVPMRIPIDARRVLLQQSKNPLQQRWFLLTIRGVVVLIALGGTVVVVVVVVLVVVVVVIRDE